ncbi:unnamed protein product [Euphydryas editha]|uniref:Tryptophan synthase beta chain-like PALP domain-containing protein n=1 Tax=Euphydryas editha TaxID=104508 RepID=A0AAU9U6W4_EUPED|nr:unnamed protein product [Euphydryas editha]
MFNLINSKQKLPSLRKDSLHWKSPYAQKLNNSILDFVGNTPLIKLNKIPKDHGLSCEIYAKCEYMNPGGSSKDRIALAMARDAESGKYIHEDTQFVEPTSGNTGIGVAFNAALLDKKSFIVTGEKNSSEKVNTMQILGAEVIVTRKSSTEIARQIKDANPDKVVMLDQFENNINPKIHYDTTGVEILEALGKVDMFVCGAGSGGTVSGAGHRIKEKCPKCTIIVAEPEGSTMFNVNGRKHPFLVEGIGGSTVPIVLDKSVVDDFEVITDEESFLMAREVIKKEGLLCGGSSGTAMAAAIKAARKYNLGPGHRIVVVLPDGIRNYMTKFVTNQWMEAHLFMDPPEHSMRWWKHPITNLKLTHLYPIINDDFTCLEAIEAMKTENVAIVVNREGWFVGAVSKDNFRHSATNPTKLPGKKSEDFNFNDPVTMHLVKDCYTLTKNGKKGMPTMGRLSRILDITSFVVIGQNTVDEGHFIPESVITADDVLEYISLYTDNEPSFGN